MFPRRGLVAVCALLFAVPALPANDEIPKAAWKRPIGKPLENPGTKKTSLDGGHIDDGYWQGAPVGGFGAGTFARTYRGDFAHWHVKGGVHQYQTVYANQFAMYQKAEGASAGVAQVLASVHPDGPGLSSWKWDYSVGAGDYYSLYPKSWFDYKWDKFPAHVVLEQFSPILPDDYRDTSLPLAVYRWHAENPTNQAVTVSVMLSWTNMIGWFRNFDRDLNGHLDAGNFDHFVATDGVKALIFDRKRSGPVENEWDGQFAIATVATPEVEVSYHTTFYPGFPSQEVWLPFANDGRLSNSDVQWISSD